MKLFRFGCLALLLSGLFGCQKYDEFEKADFESEGAEFAIPLGKSRVSIQELLENFDAYNYVEVDSTGLIHFVYEDEVFSQSADEFFHRIDSVLLPLIPLDSSYFTIDFDTLSDEVKIDVARYKSGLVNALIYSEYEGLINFSLTVHEAVKNGQPLTIQFQVMSPIGVIFEGVPLPQGNISTAVPVEGYELRPVDGKVHIEYAALTASGDTLQLEPNHVAFENVNIQFSYFEGYFGNTKFEGERDSVSIDFFQDWEQSNVHFENPSIKLDIQNSFGIPTRSDIKVFDALTTNGPSIPIESDFINNGVIDFAYPTLAEVGQSKNTMLTMSADNSNVKDLLSAKPVAIDYQVDAIANPANDLNLKGFITDSSFYSVSMLFDIPLHGRASGFDAVDSFDIDFSDYDVLKEVEFKLVADNNMPIGIATQGYFLDSTGVVLDSLFDSIGYPIEGAPVDANGIVTGKQTTVTFVNFDAVRFDGIRKATKLEIHALLATTDNGQTNVKIFSDQDVEIRMGMKVKL